MGEAVSVSHTLCDKVRFRSVLVLDFLHDVLGFIADFIDDIPDIVRRAVGVTRELATSHRDGEHSDQAGRQTKSDVFEAVPQLEPGHGLHAELK